MFSLFAAWFPGGATLSQPYLQLFPGPYTEPDKRISQTSGSPVNCSDRLVTTKWTQVFADIRLRPPNPLEGLQVAFPRIGSTLALTIQPLEQDPFCVIQVGTALG